MDSGIGEGFTHADHPALAHQLFAAYARAVRVRVLASVMGVEGLPENDQKFLAFGDAFEQRFVAQDNPRTLEDSMEVGWALLRDLPVTELTRLSREQIERQIEGHRDKPVRTGTRG
jgi:V/A-type H+-transporting ATPase subunit B